MKTEQAQTPEALLQAILADRQKTRRRFWTGFWVIAALIVVGGVAFSISAAQRFEEESREAALKSYMRSEDLHWSQVQQGVKP